MADIVAGAEQLGSIVDADSSTNGDRSVDGNFDSANKGLRANGQLMQLTADLMDSGEEGAGRDCRACQA